MTLTDCIALKPHASEVRRLNNWLDSAFIKATLDPLVAADLKLCLNEIIANLISHGFVDTPEPEIDIEISLQPGIGIATVEDNGRYFDLRRWKDPGRPKDLLSAPVGGFGIPLIRQRASRIEYDRLGNRNRLSITCTGRYPDIEQPSM